MSEKLSQLERFKQLKNEESILEKKLVQIQTQLTIAKENFENGLEEMKRLFNVNSFEELRELRKTLDRENIEMLDKYAKDIEHNKTLIAKAEEAIKNVKENIE